MNVFSKFLEYIFPPTCAVCKKTGFHLCLDCTFQIRNSTSRSLTGIYSGFSYQNPAIKRILKSLKFRRRKKLGLILGNLLYEKILDDLYEERSMSLHKEILVIPIPLSRKRHGERGFNQSEEIAKGFVQNDNLLVVDSKILFRKIDRKPQSSIHLKRERLENILNVFEVKDRKKVTGKTFVLIDDIVTTGSTLKEAEKTLKKAGARKVILVSVAH